jgi:hypothetical protein
MSMETAPPITQIEAFLENFRKRARALSLVDLSKSDQLRHSARHVKTVPFVWKSGLVGSPSFQAIVDALVSLCERSLKYLEESDRRGLDGMRTKLKCFTLDNAYYIELSLLLYELPRDEH